MPETAVDDAATDNESVFMDRFIKAEGIDKVGRKVVDDAGIINKPCSQLVRYARGVVLPALVHFEEI